MFTSDFANWMTLKEIKLLNLGSGDKPMYATCKVAVMYCKSDNALYQVGFW